MPKWGLTEEMRAAAPYGLSPALLEPAKVITDPVQGDVRLTELERRIVDSPCFQRLRRVRQLGATHLVYPAATHTRFSHSLGAIEAAQELFDVVLEQRAGLNPKRGDIFGEWLEFDENDRRRRGAEAEPLYLRRVAEAIVLTRLGALTHDICHIPFGHSVEDELALLQPHDENLHRFEGLWGQVDAEARQAIEAGLSLEGKSLYDDVLPLILPKHFAPQEKLSPDEDPGVADISYPFAQDIVGNTISADLLDYLTRDHRFTGLPAELGKRFLDGFYVSRSDARMPRRMVLRIVKKQRERSDTITELLKYLRYRYELSERALAHHAKLAADAMVGKLLGLYHDYLLRKRIEERTKRNKALDERLSLVPRGNVAAMAVAANTILGVESFEKLRNAARGDLEKVMLDHGDDGLLERLLADMKPLVREDTLAEGIFDIAKDLLERRLYASVAHFDDQAHAERLWKEYGQQPDRRRVLERDVARYAELQKPWQVAVWVSPERMRLKPALVLVDDDDMVETMLKRESSSHGRGRGVDIYEAHRRLWSLEVFVHRALRDREEVPWIQAAFAKGLNLKAWSDPRLPVALDEVGRQQLGDELRLTRAERRRLEEELSSFFEGSGAPDVIGGEATLTDLVSELRTGAEKLGFPAPEGTTPDADGGAAEPDGTQTEDFDAEDSRQEELGL